MNHRDGLEGGAGFRKLKDDTATSAIAESRDPVGVNTRCREQNVQRDATDGLHPFSVGQQGHGPCQHGFGPAKEGLSAMIVHREGDMAVRGKIVGAAPLVIVQPNAVVSDEHRGPGTLAVWPCQMGGHDQTICVVGNSGRCNVMHVLSLAGCRNRLSGTLGSDNRGAKVSLRASSIS
jgi:hypothetical protein